MGSTLSQEVHERLKAEVLSGHLPPGSPLSEQELMERLGVGRTPVREALIRLQEEGLVRIVPRRGAFVVSLTAQEVQALYQLRELLEPAALEWAAGRITPDDIAAYRERFRGLLARPVPPLETVRADVDFHLFIARRADNGFLLDSLRRLHQLNGVYWIWLARDFDVGHYVRDHLQLLDALERGDLAGAVRVMREHIRRAYREALLGCRARGDLRPPLPGDGDGDGRRPGWAPPPPALPEPSAPTAGSRG